MGILNVTPDSFYDGGKSNDPDSAFKQAEKMLSDGADIIDVGGYSTRPGATEISEEEELDRVVPVITDLKKAHPKTIISVDTFRSKVAEKAVAAGASIINDVSGGALDKRMFEVVADLKTPYVLMHMRGTPATMQSLNTYNHLLTDVVKELSTKISQLHNLGVNDIIVDPGFGFAKSIAQNYEMLKNLSYFEVLEAPVLVGLSRKAMIYKTLGVEAGAALNGTTALHMAALMNGASILRVHDVKEAKETVTLYNKINN